MDICNGICEVADDDGGAPRLPIAFANAAADKNPADNCGGNWFCHRPKFNGGKFGDR